MRRIRLSSLAAPHRLRCFRLSQNAVASRWNRWRMKSIGFAGLRIRRNDLRHFLLISYPVILILVMMGPHVPDKSVILLLCSLLLTPTSRIHPYPHSLLQAPPYVIWYGFLGRVVDLALYETKVLGSKPPPGGLSKKPRLTFVTFAPVSVHSPHKAHIEFVYALSRA